MPSKLEMHTSPYSHLDNNSPGKPDATLNMHPRARHTSVLARMMRGISTPFKYTFGYNILFSIMGV